MAGTDDSAISEQQALPPGTILEGKYELEGRLGSGGMGVVYAAMHLQLKKRVAIKMLAPDLSERQDLVARVVREARSASATGHPNVAMVTDLGWMDQTPFFVMEMVDGGTLDDLVKRDGPMPPSMAATLTCQVLDGLQAVHDVGIVHRDLKPSNIMVGRDRRRGPIVKLVDFGISKLTEPEPGEEQELTRPGAVMGTPRHMAPEQVLAEPDVDHRADIHAAGSLLYTLLVGHSPFRGANSTATMARVLHGDYEAPTTIVAGLPAELEAVVDKAMAVKREDRYQNAEDMRRDLLPFVRPESGDVTIAATSGPPGVAEDDELDVDDLPPLVAVSGTEIDSQGQWPSAEVGRTVVPPGGVLSVGDPRLEIDVPEGWQAGDLDVAPVAKRGGGTRSIPWGALLVVVVLVVGGWAAWNYRGDLGAAAAGVGKSGSRAKPGEVVLIMITTKPKDALVFVDDVQHAERPISIPKTGEYVKLRIEAEGYEPRVMQLEAKKSRTLQVALDRKR